MDENLQRSVRDRERSESALIDTLIEITRMLEFYLASLSEVAYEGCSVGSLIWSQLQLLIPMPQDERDAIIDWQQRAVNRQYRSVHRDLLINTVAKFQNRVDGAQNDIVVKLMELAAASSSDHKVKSTWEKKGQRIRAQQISMGERCQSFWETISAELAELRISPNNMFIHGSVTQSSLEFTSRHKRIMRMTTSTMSISIIQHKVRKLLLDQYYSTYIAFWEIMNEQWKLLYDDNPERLAVRWSRLVPAETFIDILGMISGASERHQYTVLVYEIKKLATDIQTVVPELIHLANRERPQLLEKLNNLVLWTKTGIEQMESAIDLQMNRTLRFERDLAYARAELSIQDDEIRQKLVSA